MPAPFPVSDMSGSALRIEPILFQQEGTGTAAALRILDVHGSQIVVHLKAKKSQHDAEETIFFGLDPRRGASFAFPADSAPYGCGGRA